MVQVSAEEAKAKLLDLIASAIKGETVLITQDGRQTVQLVPVEPVERRPQFGSAKGLITAAEDFDAPVDGSEDDDPFLSVIGLFSAGPITSEEIDLELYGPITVEMNQGTRAEGDEA